MSLAPLDSESISMTKYSKTLSLIPATQARGKTTTKHAPPRAPRV